MNSSILLMTACVNPQGMPDTALQDVDIRLNQYVKAVDFYLNHTNLRILFIDNSGYDITHSFSDAVDSGRLEIIAYNGNDFDRALGKGFGESLVIEKALLSSQLLSDATCIIKVSGRHIVNNIKAISQISQMLVSKDSFVVCDINKKTRGANSDMFIGSKDFFECLVSNKVRIDESKGRWFEHALFETIEQYVKAGNEFQYLPLPLNQEGQSGSMGIAFKKPTLKMYGMNLVKAILYKFKILKVC